MKDVELDERQRRAVSYVAGGLSAAEAFRKAGFSASYARKASTRMKSPLYLAALEHERAALREASPYSLAAAVMEIDSQIKGALAGERPNFMAGAKLLDLKCRLYGLVKEKLEVVTVDLSAALLQAEQRVFQHVNQPRLPSVGQAIEAADPYCGPGVRGNPFGED